MSKLQQILTTDEEAAIEAYEKREEHRQTKALRDLKDLILETGYAADADPSKLEEAVNRL